jgi:hypothetical protein
MKDFFRTRKVDDVGVEELGVVVQHVDRWLLGRLTTLSRNGRLTGNGLVLIRGLS